MKRIIKAGATSNVLHIFISDSSSSTGAGLTGLAYNSSGLSAYYIRPGQTSAAAITLAAITALGTFVSGGFKEIDSVNMPGWYEFDPPDACMAANAPSCSMMLKGAANMAPLPIEVELNDPANGYNINLNQMVPAFTGKPSAVGPLLYFIRQNAQNRLDFNKSTNNMVLYEDDGVTTKLTFAMSDSSTDAIRGAGA